MVLLILTEKFLHILSNELKVFLWNETSKLRYSLSLSFSLTVGHAFHMWGYHPWHHHQPPRRAQSYDHWSLDWVSPGEGGCQQRRERWRHALQWCCQRTESLQPTASVRLSPARKWGNKSRYRLFKNELYSTEPQTGNTLYNRVIFAPFSFLVHPTSFKKNNWPFTTMCSHCHKF